MNDNREGDLFDGESEILKELEDAYLTAHPNPERIGCPSLVLIEQVVSGQIRPPVGSELVQHLTRCSPCFRIFIDARNRLRARRRRRSLLYRFGGIAAIVALVLIAGVVLLWNTSRTGSQSSVAVQKPPSEAADVTTITLDLQRYSLERSESGPNNLSNIVRPTLPRKNLNLNLALPIGFEDGPYDVRVSRTEDDPALLESRGTARLVDNVVQLETSLDLTKLSPGMYLLGMRQPGLSWAHVQILVK